VSTRSQRWVPVSDVLRAGEHVEHTFDNGRTVRALWLKQAANTYTVIVYEVGATVGTAAPMVRADVPWGTCSTLTGQLLSAFEALP
jgi:hypothetical protein